MTGNYSPKILIVDDNPLFLKMVEHEFKKQGFIVTASLSALNAIELLQNEVQPDIILSDYEMPEMNGIEFRYHLMQDELLKDIPFVFLTYSPDKELMVRGLDLRAVDYVIKDTPVKVIISKIKNILLVIGKQRELTEFEVKKSVASLNFQSIPIAVPEVKGYQVDFWHQAYHNIPGGDFIDFIKVSDRHTFILLGDVMGKKWRAWFFTYGFLSYIRSAIRLAAFDGDYSPAKLLSRINYSICYDDVLKDILASLSLFLVDSDAERLVYAGAGDLPLLHYNTSAGKLISLQSPGLLLGLFEDSTYTEQEISLQKGDSVFAFTDGMTDFADADATKSDYNAFHAMIKPYLTEENAFEQMKHGLFSKGLNNQVDDQSIIRIIKS